MRSLFLATSQSKWLQEHATRHSFMRRAVSRFMPGETVAEALDAASALRKESIGVVLTCLGENVTTPSEAETVMAHYLDALALMRERNLTAELSVKLTHLGLDFDPELCYRNLARIAGAASEGTLWIDMEATPYVDATLEMYRRSRAAQLRAGVCLQAYLYRTAADLESLLPLSPAIRLVKGAYNEPPDRAFPRKRDVDENFFTLATRLLSVDARAAHVRAAIATHDRQLIQKLTQYAGAQNIPKDCFEFQMLYGIQRTEQLRLAREGWRTAVLISYGSYWFPWYMRRLAERPANAWFVVRSLLSA
ncbi:MAG TPA: proline dehydrogenase family protein [Terriglobia bacterium]|nr:proline dehydrogenase family protein [Terriglobia bacterium]